jgi:acetylornithine/N-succinyldiaminopimelate aminotransferase
LNVPNTEFVTAARRTGLLVVGAGDNVVRLLPPLIITEEHVREAMEKLTVAAKTFETNSK